MPPFRKCTHITINTQTIMSFVLYIFPKKKGGGKEKMLKAGRHSFFLYPSLPSKKHHLFTHIT